MTKYNLELDSEQCGVLAGALSIWINHIVTNDSFKEVNEKYIDMASDLREIFRNNAKQL